MSCPICAKPSEKTYKPFCSKRCADVDLAKWMSGSYTLPGEREEDIAEALDAALEDKPQTH